jgi:hypothetical protein
LPGRGYSRRWGVELSLRARHFQFRAIPQVQFGWPEPQVILDQFQTDPDLLWVTRDYHERLARAYRASVVFMGGDTDLDISELDVSNAYATDDVSLILELQSTTGQVQYATRLELEADIQRALFVRIPGTIRASLLHATISGPPHRANVWLDDVRVLGQTPALAAYIRNRLTFPGH